MLQLAGSRSLRALVLLGFSLALVGVPMLSEAATTRTRRASEELHAEEDDDDGVEPAWRRPRYSASKSRQRRLAMARARQAAYARQLVEIQTPQFKAGADGQLVPDVRAGAAIIYNPATHQVLYESNAQTPRSIASITKVMTAVAFLENEVDFDREVDDSPRRPARRVDDVPAAQRPGDDPAVAAPAADRLRQRRRAHARARIAVRPARVRRAHEPEGGRTRPDATRATTIPPGSTPTTCRRPSTWPA